MKRLTLPELSLTMANMTEPGRDALPVLYRERVTHGDGSLSHIRYSGPVLPLDVSLMKDDVLHLDITANDHDLPDRADEARVYAHQTVRLLEMLERRKVITMNPRDARKCCGIERDEDGFCRHRPGHPIFVHRP